MNQHTPGEWKALHRGGNKWEIIAASPHVQGFTQTICELNGPWNPANYAANARLIAAAPQLLEACQAALAGFQEGKARVKVYDLLFAAIAKATGKGEA